MQWLFYFDNLLIFNLLAEFPERGPGKPTDNAFIESYNGKMRKELLNRHWFKDLEDANKKAWEWREEYNTDHPHSSFEMKTPAEFLEEWERNLAERLIS